MTPVPDFLILGAMKSGTTTLYDDLRSSDEFALSDIKEPGILATSRDDAEAARRYARHFSGVQGRLHGEASTIYTQQPKHPDVAARARAVCGKDLRLVMILRDPVERILSHLRHDLAAGRISGAAADALVSEDNHYVAVSDYPNRLRPWVDNFGQESLLCVSFEDLCARRDVTVARVVTFLGGDPGRVRVRGGISNASNEVRALREGPVARLTQSDLYRYGVRAVVPRRLRAAVKSALSRGSEGIEVSLPQDTIARLRDRFAGIEDDVAEITGQRVAILRRAGASNG